MFERSDKFCLFGTSLGALALVSFLSSAEAARIQPDDCAQVLSATTVQFLEPTTQFERVPSVFFDRLIGDKTIVLVKPDPDLSWRSEYSELDKSPQGDPRNPFFFFGEELSTQLEFRIQRALNGSIEIWVPTAPRFKEIILGTNKILKERKQATIPYLPVRTGHLNEDQLFALLLEEDKDFVMLFPFAEGDPKLTSHEVAFHLAQIVLKRALLLRAREITRLTQSLIDRIEAQATALGPLTQKLTKQLKKDRIIDVDSGAGNLLAALAGMRRDHQRQPFAKIDETNIDRLTILLESITSLVQPELHPRQAVLGLLYDAMGMFIINRHQRSTLLTLIDDFSQEKTSRTYQVTTAAQILKDLLATLDHRIAELTSAIIEWRRRNNQPL